MRDGEPSRTALVAALMRALHQDRDEGRVFADPLAWRILGDPEPLLADLRSWHAEERPDLRRFIAVRHRFAEDSLAAAVDRGTRQVVVLGAGLDTFAYRNPFPDVRVFEVDLPATGAWKRELLAAAGIDPPPTVSYVAVDLEREPLRGRLAQAGVDLEAPVFVMWLGVVPYLSVDAVGNTLGVVARVPRGEVVFDYLNPVDQLSDDVREEHAAIAAIATELGEPLSDGFDTDELHRLLRSLGFEEIEDLDATAIRLRYLGGEGDPGSVGAHVVRARAV